MRRLGGLALVLVMLLASCADDDGHEAAPTTTSRASGATSADYEPRLEPGRCDDAVPDDPRVECATLTVPADRADPDAGNVTIPVAVIRSQHPDPEPDPIVYFSGGPGFQGRAIASLFLTRNFGDRRDVILFDQRGTGASTPSLDCVEFEEAVWGALGTADPAADERRRFEEALGECRDRLEADGVNLDAYDTETTAADVEDLRGALRVDSWNLFGVSYGTTVALEVLRRNPGTVRSAILDSVYPPDVPNDARRQVESAERALAVLAAGCTADPACRDAHGDVGGTLDELVDAWNAAPYETTIDDPTTGEPRPLAITGFDTVAGLWNAMYDSALIPLLPSLLRPLRDREPIAEAAVHQLATAGVAQLTGAAEGVAIGVDCADRQRLSRQPVEDVIAAEPLFTSLLSLGPTAACELWDVDSVEPVFNEPVHSDVPVLVVAGEYDPVTPPADSEQASATLTRSIFAVLPGLGHGVVLDHECGRELFGTFVDAPTAPVDTACVDAMGPPEWAT